MLSMTLLSTSALAPSSNPPQTSALPPRLAFASVLTSTPNSCPIASFSIPAFSPQLSLPYGSIFTVCFLPAMYSQPSAFSTASSTPAPCPTPRHFLSHSSKHHFKPLANWPSNMEPLFSLISGHLSPQYHSRYLLPGPPACSLWLNLANLS